VTQGAAVEEAVIDSVDTVTNTIVLTAGLVGVFTMAANDVPVNLSPAVNDAVVDVLDAGLRTKTTSDGRYSFSRVPAGTRTIRAVAVGYQPRTQPVTVPGRPEDYDINLIPL
jgi:hypothetical protein